MNEVTVDVYEGNFPPENYGKTLEEVEATISQVIERVFRDDDGMLRSFVNGRTMKPMRSEDVKDRPQGMGAHTENSDIPREFKPVWTNYENAGQASGTCLEALCTKWQVTGDENVRELARRTVNAIVTLWENASKIEHPLGGGGKGWFPKPYAGIRNVAGMHECSIDQYVDVTTGLHSYYCTFANDDEKCKIEEIIVSFADWWYDHDYCGVYFGRAIYWKRLPWHSMAVAGFLYLNALAYSFNPCRKFQHGFEIWMELKDALLSPSIKAVDMNGNTINSLERLIALRPDLNVFWLQAATCQMQGLVECVAQGSWTAGGEGHWSACASYGYDTLYLATAHRLWPDAGYDCLTRRQLEACTRREHFYHVRRGFHVSNLPGALSGDDYRDIFHCERHTHWLSAYWRLVSLKNINQNKN